MTALQRENTYMLGTNSKDEPMCDNCMYYVPHHIKNPLGIYVEISCGHCMAGNVKHRSPWDTCKRFERK